MNLKKINVLLFLICTLALQPNVEAKMSKEAHALYQQACAYEYKNDYKSAIEAIQKAIDINGEDAMLYTKMAGLYSDIGEYEQALSAYKKAVHLRPNDAFIYISMGNILQTLGDYENAFNSFNQAQSIYPEYKYNYLNLANIEYFRKNYDNAIEYYQDFLNAYPDHIEANENLANVYYLSKQPEKACEIYSTIYKKFPSAFSEYKKYGIALFDTKQYSAATTMLEKALQNDNDNTSIIGILALSYQNIGENEKALDYFRKAFYLNPKLVELKFDYANLLGNMEKYDDAIEQYKEYLKAFPEDADAYKNLGLVYKKLDNWDLALFNLEKSYSKDTSDIETKKELAYAYHRKRDYVNALKFYNFALKSEPDNIELLANKALTLHAMNNYIAAIELYKSILEKQPNERIEKNLMSATLAYGYDLYEKEDYGQAILYFEDAINMNNKEPVAYYGYAKANEKMGCTEVAYEAYSKAVSLAPGNADYANDLARLRNSNKELLAKSENKNCNVEKKTQINEQAVTYDVLIKNGDSAYARQNYDEAIDCYTKAVIFIPSDKTTLMKIANIYKLQGYNDKALSFYNKILSLDSDSVEAYFNKGLVLANQKKYDECIKCFEKVISLSPEYPYAYYSLAMAYEQKDMTDKALEYYYLYSGIEKDERMLNIVNQKIKLLEDR